jgi:hypothetical protein
VDERDKLRERLRALKASVGQGGYQPVSGVDRRPGSSLGGAGYGGGGGTMDSGGGGGGTPTSAASPRVSVTMAGGC